MSKKPWKKCKTTGQAMSKLENVAGTLKLPDGSIDPSKFPDCNIFNVGSMAAEAGYSKQYFVDDVLPNSYFHTIRLMETITYRDGRPPVEKTITHFTHADSAQWGGEAHRKDQHEKQIKSLKQNKDKK